MGQVVFFQNVSKSCIDNWAKNQQSAEYLVCEIAACYEALYMHRNFKASRNVMHSFWLCRKETCWTSDRRFVTYSCKSMHSVFDGWFYKTRLSIGRKVLLATYLWNQKELKWRSSLEWSCQTLLVHKLIVLRILFEGTSLDNIKTFKIMA